jgi:hypothetical protein
VKGETRLIFFGGLFFSKQQATSPWGANGK